MTDETSRSLPGQSNGRVYQITEGIIAFSLLMYALFSPHSIAITEGSFLVGLLAWGVQCAWTRKFKPQRTALDVAILGFFACCVVSSFLSYDPLVSIKGLKSPAFFLAFYLVSNKVRSLRFAGLLALIIVTSSMASVVYSGGQLAQGRGIRIDGIRDDSPLARENLAVGDVILEADGKRVETLEAVSAIVDSQRGRVRIKYARNETTGEITVSRRNIRKSPGVGAERLGIVASPGRNFRVTGFYSHYETYAEVLQLIAALGIGLFIGLRRKNSPSAILLVGALVLLIGTLVLTSTRAAIAGLAVGVGVMALASFQRRTVVVAALAIMILTPLAFLSLERSRGIAIFDPQEGSTAYRLEVWPEALAMIKDHPLAGIGKGSEAMLKDRLGLYDSGRLPPGHFHSTPIQIATWWGLPALVFYFAMMTIILTTGWKVARLLRARNERASWGLVLGGIGAVAAFNVSSIFHFNFGDGEVVMMFWMLTGLVFAVRRLAGESSQPESDSSQPRSSQDSSDRNRRRAQEEAAESSARVAGATPH